MGVKTEILDSIDFKEELQKYKNALIMNISDMLLKRTVDISDMNLDEVVDARLFSETGELHIFNDDGKMRFVRVTDEEDDTSIEEAYIIGNRKNVIGKRILVKKYINFDDDGQAYVYLTRLMGVE